MKKSILILLIYLSGVFFSYKYGKYVITRETKMEWLVKDRIFVSSIIIYSYISVAALGIVDLITSMDMNKKANW
jgi:hypothetical protein